MEVGPLQLCATEVGLLQLHPAEVGPLQLRPKEVGLLQPSTHQIGTLFAIQVLLRQTLYPLLPEMRGKLISHRIGTLLCLALQLDGVGWHNWPFIVVPAQEEPRYALAWLQAGRQQRGQLVGCRAQPRFMIRRLRDSFIGCRVHSSGGSLGHDGSLGCDGGLSRFGRGGSIEPRPKCSGSLHLTPRRRHAAVTTHRPSEAGRRRRKHVSHCCTTRQDLAQVDAGLVGRRRRVGEAVPQQPAAKHHLIVSTYRPRVAGRRRRRPCRQLPPGPRGASHRRLHRSSRLLPACLLRLLADRPRGSLGAEFWY
eukprot:scaffold47068_cov63-Phaeocystis_antarctica.AAC.5